MTHLLRIARARRVGLASFFAMTALLAAQPAIAATVATGSLYVAVSSFGYCFVTNPGTTSVAIGAVERVSQTGAVLNGVSNVVLGAGQVYTLVGSGGGITYCRATGVSSKRIRLNYCHRSTSGSPCESVSDGQ